MAIETGAAFPEEAAPPGVLRAVLRALDGVAYWMAFASGVVFLAVSFYITIDVIGRKFFGISSAVTDEMGGYALAFGGMGALAWTLRSGGHVRIDVLLPRLPPLARTVLDYVALALMAFFAAIVAFYAWFLAADSYAVDARAMSFLRTPLFMPQGVLAFGLSVLAVEAVVILVLGIVESISAGRLVTLSIGREEDVVVVPATSGEPLL